MDIFTTTGDRLNLDPTSQPAAHDPLFTSHGHSRLTTPTPGGAPGFSHLAVVTQSYLSAAGSTLAVYLSQMSTNDTADDPGWVTTYSTATNTTSTPVSNATTASALELLLSRFQAAEEYLLPVVCALGIVLNGLNLLVLSHKSLKESPYVYLKAMAVLCLAALIIYLNRSIFDKVTKHHYYWNAFNAYFTYPCVNICTNSTMWATSAMTIERFLLVRRPVQARSKCNSRSAKVRICLIVGVITLLNIPRFMMYKVVQVEKQPPGVYELGPTPFRESTPNVVITWVYSALIQFIPMAILLVTNVYLALSLQRSRNLRKQHDLRNNMEERWKREQARLTVTLVIIIFFFLLLIMPSAFTDLHVAYAIFGHGTNMDAFRKSNIYRVTQKITNLLVFIQMSSSFILYSTFNKKFQTVFKRMLHRWNDSIFCRLRIKRYHNNNNSSSGLMQRLMRQRDNALAGSSSVGADKAGHGHLKAQMRCSNASNSSGKQSISSGKDYSQTKTSLLEVFM